MLFVKLDLCFNFRAVCLWSALPSMKRNCEEHCCWAIELRPHRILALICFVLWYKTNFKRKEFISANRLQSLQWIEGWNSRVDKTRNRCQRGVLFTRLLPQPAFLCSLSLVAHLFHCCSSPHLPTSIINKGNAFQICPRVNLMDIIPQLRLHLSTCF